MDLRIAHDLVRELGTPVPGDRPDLVASQGHAAVGAVDVGVHAGARLQLEDFAGVVQRPDAGQRHVEVAHQRLGALLQHGSHATALCQGDSHVRGQLRQTRPLEQRGLAPAALAAHFGVAQLPLDGRDEAPQIPLGEEILRARLHGLDRDIFAHRARDEDERRVGVVRA